MFPFFIVVHMRNARLHNDKSFPNTDDHLSDRQPHGHGMKPSAAIVAPKRVGIYIRFGTMQIFTFILFLQKNISEMWPFEENNRRPKVTIDMLASRLNNFMGDWV